MDLATKPQERVATWFRTLASAETIAFVRIDDDWARQAMSIGFVPLYHEQIHTLAVARANVIARSGLQTVLAPGTGGWLVFARPVAIGQLRPSGSGSEDLQGPGDQGEQPNRGRGRGRRAGTRSGRASGA